MFISGVFASNAFEQIFKIRQRSPVSSYTVVIVLPHWPLLERNTLVNPQAKNLWSVQIMIKA